MRRKPAPGLFITGNDTGVGKTYVAALIAKQLTNAGHRVGVYKPTASGGTMRNGRLVSEDAVQLWEAAGRHGEFNRVCSQVFTAPIAPHLAAKAEGRSIDSDLLRSGVGYWRDNSEIVIVEGAGGLMSPLGEKEYVADLAYDLNYPLIVVVRNSLGVINQTLQTLITAATFRHGLTVAGVVLNQPIAASDDASLATNLGELEARCVPPVLTEVLWNARSFSHPVDWLNVANPMISGSP